MKKYVLTGGPGTGKSTIILALEQQGEYTIREAAEDYIKLRQAQGQPEPWTEPDFQDKILEKQVQREARIHTDAKRVFIDRGALDGLAYTDKEETCRKIKEAEKRAGYEKKVFLIEQLEHTDNNKVRREDHEEAKQLELKLEKTYKARGYETIRIPAGTAEQRVEKILEEI